MRGSVVAALVGIATVLVILGLMFAQGAPTAPKAELYTPLQPSAAQSIQVQLQFGFYSIVTPNTIWQLGSHFVYSAVEKSSSGTVTVLATNQTIAPSIQGESGQFYIETATIALNTVAACSPATCGSVSENVTITAQATVATPYVAWFSPVTVAVFSSANSGSCTAGIPCPPSSQTPVSAGGSPVPTTTALDTFYLELFAPLTVVVAIGAFIVIVLGGKHPVLIATAVVAALALVVEFIVW